MLRLFDFECQTCGRVAEHLIDVPSGTRPELRWRLPCAACDKLRAHERCAVNLFARYAGDKTYSPEVYGGKYDTMGRERLPQLPTLPEGASDMDYKTLFAKPEYREIVKERRAIKKRNLAKRKRAYQMAAGENVSVRTNPLPGDPKF